MDPLQFKTLRRRLKRRIDLTAHRSTIEYHATELTAKIGPHVCAPFRPQGGDERAPSPGANANGKTHKNSTMCTNRKKNRKLRSTTLLLGFRYVTRRQHKMTPNASCETRSPRERRTPLLDSTCIFRSEPHVLPSPRRTLPFQQLPVFIPLAVSNPLAETGPCSRLSGHLAEKAQLARRAEKSNSAGPRSQHRFPPDSPGWTTTLLRP